MRKHVKVALSGDGGDEVLGGYVRYRRARQLAALGRWLPAAPHVSDGIARLAALGGRRGARLSKAWTSARQARPAMLLSLHTYFTEQERLEMYRPDFAALAVAEGPTFERFSPLVPAHETDPVKQLIAAEFQLRLHADYLRKVDVASSAHGLEVRVPYLDNRLCDLAMTLPTRYRLGPSGQTKLIARRLAEAHLPPAVAGARKRGFGIPLDQWAGPRLRGFLEGLLLDPDARVTRLLQPSAVARVWQEFIGERRSRQSRFQRCQRAFLLVSFELWLRKWQPTL
jgi:asparagine synthase (glutamine-hydrolysing)